MKRIQEKIKDLVELQPYEEVQNFIVEPARVLAAYRFTNVTSDLMVRWLDNLGMMPVGSGVARALAGIRGVGKSHLLAAFSALAAMPELSSTLNDQHVATSARRLSQNRCLIVNIQRGTRLSLIDELRSGFAAAFGNDEADWADDPQQILAVAASRAGNTPLVVIIDTAFGRPGRVSRDDGPLLSELAEIVKSVKAFVGLALDDDISGADGANVALIGSYQIDYLDHEHLYQVADIHLFHKNIQGRAILHDIYLYLRSVIPGFNWSEPRFAMVYPMHPVVLDITSAVRLYSPTFAFLPFSAATFGKVANRPAHSLVALDEVFDRVEYDLRKSEPLKEAFTAYDKTLNEAISVIPVMQRLQAKLALKCLFILSLDGRGSTARELGAASLIYDENEPESSITRLQEMLLQFHQYAPPDAIRVTEEGNDKRYCFNITASIGFDDALANATQELNEADYSRFLRQLPRLRFEDYPHYDLITNETVDFHVSWRGMARRGRLRWSNDDTRFQNTSERYANADSPEVYDWEIAFLPPKSKGIAPFSSDLRNSWAAAFAVWQPAILTHEEEEILKRLTTLRTNSKLSSAYGDAAQAAERMYTSLAERIWTRVYIEDGLIHTGGYAQRVPDEARTAPSLSEALTTILSPILSMRYPLHPIFTEPLGLNEVTHLVISLFGGANQGAASVQELAKLFVAPLGLVSHRGDTYALEAGEQILRQPWVREIATMTDEAGGDIVPISEIYRRLRGEPYGLLREAQQLVLAALIAQRRIELVTKSGERIGRRMLDHKLVWDEIEGAARSANLLHSAEELTAWARRLTENHALGSMADPTQREIVRSSLVEWLAKWRSMRLIERFETLPEDAIVTRAWRLVSTSAQKFDIAAEAVETSLVDVISLEEGLQRISDTFNDSKDVLEQSHYHLKELENYVQGLEPREQIRRYIAGAEPTTVDEIEDARLELINLLDDPYSAFNAESNKRFSLLWREFQMRYSQHYAASHATTMSSPDLKYGIDSLLRTDDWREFEALSKLDLVNPQHWERASELLDQGRNARCELNVRQVLMERPICACSFRLASATTLKQIPLELEAIMRAGLASYKHALKLLITPLAIALDAIARIEASSDLAARARSLSGAFARGAMPERFTCTEANLLVYAVQRMTTPPPVRIEIPIDGYGLLTREELRARLNQWVDDLPSEPALVEVVMPNGKNGH